MMMSVITMQYFIEVMLTLKEIKSLSKRSFEQQNLTPVVISYESY